ncbi:MarR family winged helix-turn-helix transcriptional regulator [Microvirga sp. VF16]|uniref:MarR family winged helix-turn-helix transcriptional regulator n=1 Tax=Microvirga sp. VF16 TaxID=2807101 RepID=UPI00193E479C|nr:MarR family transcriptional regulator [Microvirga sp. VF16]QRM35479.1 MarR family transcriptional regulator [Microvirga sp. VF16]
MLTKYTEETIGLLLVDGARLLRLQIDRAFEEAGLGLTAGEARTLAYVALYPASRQTALAAQMNVEPMTLVIFLDRLESRGLIAREPDPTDRRAKIVQLAPDAQSTLKQIQRITRQVQDGALQDFHPEEVEMLRTLLKRMRANLASREPGRGQA